VNGFISNYSLQVESLAKKKNGKLNPRLYDPYQVVKILGPVAYQLKLTQNSKSIKSFMYPLLKKALVPSVAPKPLTSSTNISGGSQKQCLWNSRSIDSLARSSKL